MYNRGFVFGKYHPFHNGHKALIDFALDHCNELFVVVCESNLELISGQLRCTWISQNYLNNDRLKVILLPYLESELPNTSIPSENVSELWAKRFLEILPEMDVVFTSELYGDYVAKYMNIVHHSFDPNRLNVPISASQITINPQKYWQFLPESVKPYYCKKVVLLGSESTGKTVLAESLSREFDATLVSEAGRDLIPNSNEFTKEHLYQVVEEQGKRIVEASKGPKPIVIIDTDLHITNSYATFKFGQELDLHISEYEKFKADLYLYLNLDVPFVQDGTRMSEKERLLLDLSHRSILRKYYISFYELDGDYQHRFLKAKQYISDIVIIS